MCDNAFMMHLAMNEYRFPAGYRRMQVESFMNVDDQAWTSRVHCLVFGKLQVLPVHAWIEGDALELVVLDGTGSKQLGAPGHDPAVAFHERERLVWEDTVSGLCWYRNGIAAPYGSDDPFSILESFVADNGGGTYCDWRIPSLDELLTLARWRWTSVRPELHPKIMPAVRDRHRSMPVYASLTPLAQTVAWPESREWTAFDLTAGVEVELPNATSVRFNSAWPRTRCRHSDGSEVVLVLPVRGDQCRLPARPDSRSPDLD